MEQTALTRWREDATRDCWGSFIYLRDIGQQKTWSTAHQPTLQAATTYEAIFSQGRAEFRTRTHDIDAHTEIAVSPEDDVEVRRVTLTNHSDFEPYHRSDQLCRSGAEFVRRGPGSSRLQQAIHSD